MTAPELQADDRERCEWCGVPVPAFRKAIHAYQWRNGHAGECRPLTVERFGTPAALVAERFTRGAP